MQYSAKLRMQNRVQEFNRRMDNHRFICPICPKAFNTDEAYRAHYKAEHKPKVRFYA
jgi:transposase-like protein